MTSHSKSVYEVEVKFEGEGYSQRTIRVLASSEQEAMYFARLEYCKHVVVVGLPKVIT